MDSVSPLLSRVRRGTCGTTAAALYRVMVAYYSMHADNAALLEDIERYRSLHFLEANLHYKVHLVILHANYGMPTRSIHSCSM